MYIDLFICVLLLWAIISGWRDGFLKEVFSTLGVVLGLVIAAALYFYIASDYFEITGSDTNQWLNIGAFLILWIIMPLVLGLIANILTKALEGILLGLPNSLLGAAFSVVKFVILISCVLSMMGSLKIIDRKMVKDSKLYEPIVSITPFIKDCAQEIYNEVEIPKKMKDASWVEEMKDGFKDGYKDVENSIEDLKK